MPGVGAIGDVPDDVIGQGLTTGDLLDQIGPVAAVQAIERQHADLRLAGPRRLELGAECHDQQMRCNLSDLIAGSEDRIGCAACLARPPGACRLPFRPTADRSRGDPKALAGLEVNDFSRLAEIKTAE